MKYYTAEDCRDWITEEHKIGNVSEKFFDSFIHHLTIAERQQQVSVEPVVKPACETDKTQCKFCTRETTAEDFGYGKDKVCKSCLDKAIANELRNMEQ